MKSVLHSSLVVFLLASPAFSQVPNPPAVSPLQPTVVTHGQASVTARPDRAFVTMAAESRSRNSGDAQKQNAAAMTAVLQKIEQAGVPKVDDANGRQTFRSDVARNTVEVRLDDIDRVGVVIDAAAAGGATTMSGIRFDVRNRAALDRDASTPVEPSTIESHARVTLTASLR